MFSQPSSPVLKARAQSNRLYSNMLYCLVTFCLSVWLISLMFNDHDSDTTQQYPRPSIKVPEPYPILDTQLQVALSNLTAHNISNHALSLVAVLPVTSTSISTLDLHLRSLLGVSHALVEIVILSSPAYHPRVRSALRNVLSTSEHLEVEVSIAHLLEGVGQDVAVLQTAQGLLADWILLLDEHGLMGLDEATRELLVLKTMPPVSLPTGPRGYQIDNYGASCLKPSMLTQPAEYLAPPLVIPASFLSNVSSLSNHRDTWRTLGTHVSRSTPGSSGGLVLGSGDSSLTWCQHYAPKNADGFPVPLTGFRTYGTSDLVGNMIAPARFADSGVVLLVSHASDIRYIVPIACKLIKQGHHVSLIALYGSEPYPHAPRQFRECRDITSQHITTSFSQLADFRIRAELLSQIPDNPDIVISSIQEQHRSLLLPFLGNRTSSVDRFRVDIHISKDDLPYCDWMGSLTIEELRSWHIPQIEFSVVTDARPHSLRRLLSSLTNARYFGDTIHLRINMEQTADAETLRLVSEYEWPHGHVFSHHRVVHGGLMAAVVESWFPRDNDSYGLILEDDVELSPLFYAWTKMSLLRYRYGRHRDRSSTLFGISLYQQKNLELRPEGRHLFDARAAFASAGLKTDPSTPYLSQIPCSWGALYFPEHWREFHAYLPARLSALAWPLTTPVVPDVRSNRWAHSWKKYFIELVFLRGYVMLYPNYSGFRSLSTNHLETGAHVKEMPVETYLRKKQLFNVPLMPLPPVRNAEVLTKMGGEGGVVPGTGLLELPGEQMPEWTSLPILDLLGVVVDDETVVQRGRERRMELTGCDGIMPHDHDVRSLLCLH